MPSTPSSPEISIPGHEMLNLIGEGGMARVFAGARLGAGNSIKPVAVKVIRPELSADARYQEMFLSEGRTAMMFGHPNIVTVFDIGAVDDRLYMVMEWVDGVTVGHFARSIVKKRGRPLELSIALAIITQLLCALDYAHNYKRNRKKVGIVHRDISPHNVMITSSGAVKLLDFGVARITGGRTTRSVKGNLHYMPREQAQGGPRVESDLYAVGALAFELIEGAGFRSHCKTEDEALNDIFHGGVPELRRTDVPEDLRRLLRELLSVSWQDRPHSAVEVIKRIERMPIEQFSSVLPIKELYWAFFGDSHSGLTRFAHRDPQMWVDHMRKMGRANAERRAVGRRSGLNGTPEAAAKPAPPTLLHPRAHEAARLHPVVDEDTDPFEASKTVRFDPDRIPQPQADETAAANPGGEQPPATPASVDATVRLPWPASPAEIDREESERQDGSITIERTVRMLPNAFVAVDPSIAGGAPSAVVVEHGWRFSRLVRTVVRSTAHGPMRWRDLINSPLGLILLAMLTFGVVMPIACIVSMNQGAEVRR